MAKRTQEVDYNLKLMAEVFKLEHLHWGYFPEKRFSGAKTLAELRQAQVNYAERLFSYIPEGVVNILDVGAGLGKTAALLQKKGYRVHCLSNDKYQETVINQKYPEIPFTRSKFEESDLAQQFDLVLMSESVQYLDWPAALSKLKQVLKPKGYLLLADYFRKEREPFYHHCKIKQPFEQETAQFFTLIKEDDITDHVLPTLEYAEFIWNEYVLPTSVILSEAIRERISPLLRFICYRLFKKGIDKIQRYVYQYAPDKFNKKKFKAKMNYVIQLWQLK